MNNQELIEKTKRISLFLRTKARSELKKIDKEMDEPYLFYVEGYNGKHPVFIFSSFPCDRYCQGFCTPCLYSNIVHSTINKEKIYNSLITQTEFILKNFSELISRKQTGTGHKNLNKVYPNKKLVTIELCGEGSFLANSEIPKEHRKRILKMFEEHSKKEQLNMQIILETKVIDFLDNVEEFSDKEDLVRNLNLTLLFGFEAVDEFTRQVVYNKGLEMKDFELAISKAQELGLKTGAFLFCGFHSLTQKELIENARESIEYCKKNNIAIYLMLPNLQKFTLNHLLYKNNKYNFPDPRTILEIIKFLIKDSKGDKSSYYFDGYNWSIGGLTTYPEPELFLFSNKKNISCNNCSMKIKKAIYDLAKNYNIEQFNQAIKEVENCPCREEYERFINNESNINIRLRVMQNLDFADKQKENYTKEVI